jgi:hypothetical protein
MKSKSIFYVFVLLFIASWSFAVTVQPNSIDFGTFQQGTIKKGSFTITNTATIHPFAFTISSDSPVFHAGPTSGIVPIGGSLKIDVEVQASGSQRGNLTATITIHGTNTTAPPILVPLKATVVSLKTATHILDFGTVKQGSAKTLQYTVQNDSSISGVFDIGRDPTFFVPSNPVVVSLGTKTMTLTLPSNANPGNYTGSVLITEEGKPGNQLSIPIKAIVIAVSQ